MKELRISFRDEISKEIPLALRRFEQHRGVPVGAQPDEYVPECGRAVGRECGVWGVRQVLLVELELQLSEDRVGGAGVAGDGAEVGARGRALGAGRESVTGGESVTGRERGQGRGRAREEGEHVGVGGGSGSGRVVHVERVGCGFFGVWVFEILNRDFIRK